MASAIAVISPRFCCPGGIRLTIVKKITPFTGGNFMVIDDDGDIIFKVKERLLSMHSRHVILDGAGNPIATLKKKMLSSHRRWQVFKGDSSDPDDDVFTASQFRNDELDVILSDHKERISWDFKVVHNWLERSCIIYNRNQTAIAQVQKKHKFRCVGMGKDTLSVIVSPNVDYSFVAALVVILDRINEEFMDD